MASISLKYSDLVKQFDGEGDFSEWIRKLELVGNLQKIKDMSVFLPLFLSGGAFAVYENLDSDVRCDYAKLKNALLDAFSPNKFLAYEQFISRKLMPGESVDVYVSDLRRLSNLVDMTTSDHWIKCAMISGLPCNVKLQLKSACSLEKMDMSEIIDRTRMVLGSNVLEEGGAVAQLDRPTTKIGLALGNLEREREEYNGIGAVGRLDHRHKENLRTWSGSRKCYICKKDSHIARFCPSKSSVVCYTCGEVGHISSTCQKTPKKLERGTSLCCAGGFSGEVAQLPTVEISVFGMTVSALIDSGCSRSVISPALARYGRLSPGNFRITMMNGKTVFGLSSCEVIVNIRCVEMKLNCIVSDLLPTFQMLLGMDAINALGGVFIDGRGNVQLGVSTVKSAVSITESEKQGLIEIDDEDFTATFSNGRWLVEWKWKKDVTGPVLRNKTSQYSIPQDAEAAFYEEVEEWIKCGWLQPYDGPYEGLVPLMAVIQPNKNKVRPVMDYREVNQYVSSHTAASEVCGDKLRIWRRMGENVQLIDLRKAYLQIHISPKLWKYQVVKVKGITYCLTRLGFGLTAGPKIMTAIVNRVLSIDSAVRAGTDSYYDDIIVNEDKVSCKEVVQLLEKYGLISKPAEPLVGGRVLGLKVDKKNGVISWGRDNKIDELSDTATKRDVFSLCGQLVGHFPVAGWLRPACSFIKRSLTEQDWDDKANEASMTMLTEVVNRIKTEDPVKGKWSVAAEDRGVVWCDASSLAIGVCLEINNDVVEDSSWLRKPNDSAHINLAELEAVLKGINLALKWGLKLIKVKTDSATVFSWVSSLITRERRIKTHGLGEALVRRRLGLLNDLIEECDLNVKIDLVRSENNKADKLTRVPKKWMSNDVKVEFGMVTISNTNLDLIKSSHGNHHFGVDRSLYIVQHCNPEEKITKEEVQHVVQNCNECLSIDPAPVRWDHGSLECDKVWHRLAMDVTHFRNVKFLTLIDCGPSRFSVWRQIPDESSTHVTRILSQVFAERGPPSELLTDNSRTFRSEEVRHLCNRWSVKLKFRCANRPSGNGIIERNHRTIKRMAARTGGKIQDMVFWYNFSPKEGTIGNTAPSSQIYNYQWRCPGEPQTEEIVEPNKNFSIGDSVFVKPEGVRCTSKWKKGVVTGQGCSHNSVEVNGLPYHVADLRLSAPQGQDLSQSQERKGEERPRRTERRPGYLSEYICSTGDVNITGAYGI